MRWPIHSMAWVLVAAPLFLSACKQGVGDRCQVQDDCQDDLLCVLPALGNPQTGGTCQEPGTLQPGTQDAGVGDLSPAPTDASSADGAETD